MLQAFCAADVKFDIYFMQFENELNLYDIQTNILACKNLGLNYKIIEIDIIHFFESGRHLEYAQKYMCQSPQLAAHLWLLDQIDGAPVLAGNPFLRTDLNGGSFFIGLPGDLHCVYFRYLELNNRAGVPWFFIYSPEMCAAFLRLPISRKLHSERIAVNEYTYAHKCQTYVEAGFKVAARHDKYTGFEKIRELYDKQQGTQNGVGFNQLFREPMNKLNPFPESYIQLVPSAYFK